MMNRNLTKNMRGSDCGQTHSVLCQHAIASHHHHKVPAECALSNRDLFFTGVEDRCN